MIRFSDAVAVGQTKRTKEGYLVATARVARSGVQHYLASEIGDLATDAGFKPTDVVRVYRPPEEVFSDAALSTVTRVPVTLNHPPENVIAENWSKYAVGEVGDSYARDGEWVVVNPMIKDADAIKAAESTHREISLGYEAKIVPARDGVDADFEMQDIRVNHFALVTKGRAGHGARIGDFEPDKWGILPITDFQPGVMPKNHRQGGHMTTKTVVLGDRAVQVLAEDAVEVERFKDAAAKALADAQTKHAAAIAAKDEEIGKLRADLKVAQDAAKIDVDALVAARTDLVAKVKAIDAKIETAGKSDADLRKAAVAAKLGDDMVVNASDAEIMGMFKAIAKDAKPTDPVAQAFQSGLRTSDAATAMQDAHAKSITDLNAWRYAKEA